jgi:hypothetical protein
VLPFYKLIYRRYYATTRGDEHPHQPRQGPTPARPIPQEVH